MQACWNFYRFDYARYLTLRPLLRAATTYDAFAALSENEEGDAIAEAVADGALSLEAARNALVINLCCQGNALPIEATFPRFLAALARRQGAEDAAEILGALVSGGKPAEAWLNASDGLIGWLTPEETADLYHACSPLLTRNGRSLSRVGGASKRRTRRGGLVGVCVGFVRHLFNSGPLPDDVLVLLGQLLREAQERNQGLGVLAA